MDNRFDIPGHTPITIGALLMVSLSVTGCYDPSNSPIPAPTVATVDNPMEAPAWPTFRGNRTLTGVATGTLNESLSLNWKFMAEGAIVSSPVVVDGRVYFGSDDGRLYNLDADDGEVNWSYPTEFIIEAPPFVHDGIVYVGSNDFFLYAVDVETGLLKWKYETYEKIAGAANVIQSAEGDRDLIIIGSHDAFVYALDAKTGEKVWEYETNDRVNGTPAVVDNQIVFGGCDTILYVLDGATGQSSAQIELGGECYIAASVGIEGHEVFFGHHGNEFVAIDLETQDIKWRYLAPRFGFFSPPAITTDRVVFGGRDKRVHCVDRETGEMIWTFATRRKIDSGPVICGDKVVAGSGDGRLYLLSLEEGDELWSYDIGQSIFSSPAVVDGRIYVGANDGGLYAFGPQIAESERD